MRRWVGGKDARTWHSPRFAGSELVQFRFAPFAIVILRGSRLVCDAYAKAVLPDVALVTLDEETICRIGLVIITTLVLLVATDASRDFVFL